MTTGTPAAALALLVLASCGAGSHTSRPSAGTGYVPLSQRLEQKNGFKQDAGGNWTPQNDQRSSFESQGESPYFKGDYQKKSYSTSEVAKKSWWGSKQYGTQSYAGSTDGSRFKTTSTFSGQGAPESGQTAGLSGAYRTNSYATHAARETKRGHLAKPSNAETDIRRRVYPAPDIINWREQRALTVEQSRSLLGR